MNIHIKVSNWHNVVRYSLGAIAIATVALTLSGLTYTTVQQSKSLKDLKTQISQTFFADIKEPTETPITALVANSARIANILAYRLRQEPRLSLHSEFIRQLHEAVIDDNTRRAAFEQLRDAGATRSELIAIDSNTYLFRDKWAVTIVTGSYFYDRPFSKVLFFNEAFTVPPCAEGFEPYIAQISTNPSVTIEIIKDMTYSQYGHRAIAKSSDGKAILNNLTDRILLDAGCSPLISNDESNASSE
ncbi:hypothetical protein AB9X29_003710 [Vibrio vulnificus]